jgi:hypothetical protein
MLLHGGCRLRRHPNLSAVGRLICINPIRVRRSRSYIEPGSCSLAALRSRTFFWTSARYCLACSRVLIERTRARMTARCSGDISRPGEGRLENHRQRAVVDRVIRSGGNDRIQVRLTPYSSRRPESGCGRRQGSGSIRSWRSRGEERIETISLGIALCTVLPESFRLQARVSP